MSRFDDIDENAFRDMEEEEYRPKRKVVYPKCYVDKRHDGDPICKECAQEEYGKLPKSKFKGPRNCWRCEGDSETDLDDLAAEEPFFEES